MIYTLENLNDFKQLLKKNTAIIAIDYGDKYLGIAKTDRNLIISIPVDVVNNKGAQSIKDIFDQIGPSAFILGLPLQMDGTEGENCVKVRNFANKMISEFNLPIYLQDERLTTKAAQHFLNESTLKREQKNFLDNKLAASLILESFLRVANFI